MLTYKLYKVTDNNKYAEEIVNSLYFSNGKSDLRLFRDWEL